jgi:uncharacterized membrane protein YidH (DUF202 family)
VGVSVIVKAIEITPLITGDEITLPIVNTARTSLAVMIVFFGLLTSAAATGSFAVMEATRVATSAAESVTAPTSLKWEPR